MGADLLAGVRPAGVWDAVGAASDGSLPVIALVLAAALLAWPALLLLRRRPRRRRLRS
jgi:hypothetical protein